jgi:hypothetical protein
MMKIATAIAASGRNQPCARGLCLPGAGVGAKRSHAVQTTEATA